MNEQSPTNSLWLTRQQAKQIADHAAAEQPNEACGLIGGVGNRALTVIPTPNAANSPRVTFSVDEVAFVDAMRMFRANGQTLIGIYHSHPRTPPQPSPTDVEHAHYPDAAYIIVSLRHGEPELAAWHIQNRVVKRVPLSIGEQPPVPVSSLSRTQVYAVIASALVAALLVLFLSYMLLPPPPVITPTP